MSNLEGKRKPTEGVRELIRYMIDRIDSDEYLSRIYHYILPKFEKSNKKFDSIEDLKRNMFYHDFILRIEKEEGWLIWLK